MPQETLKQIQDKLAQIQTTASGLPAGTDLSGATQALGQATQQVSGLLPREPSPIPLEETQVSPPMFEPSPQPDDLSLKAQVDQQRKLLEETHREELERVNKQLEEQKKREAEFMASQRDVLTQAEPLTTPFRESIEVAERERLKIEENFFANQALVNDLDSLLTESIELTRKLQTQRVPGLAGLQQSSRMIKTQENVQGRIAVIEAVMAARNNQIGVAQGFIDRTISGIQADRKDRLNYLSTLFSFYENAKNEAGQKIFNLTEEQKDVFARQRQLIESDLARSEENVQYIKDLMMDPGTASMIANAGVTLNDTPQEVNTKMSDFSVRQEKIEMDNQMATQGYKMITPEMAIGKPEREIIRLFDSTGGERLYWNMNPEEPTEPTQTEITRDLRSQVISTAEPILTQSEGEDGFVDPEVYLDLRQQYFEAFGNTSGFDQLFSNRLSPQERERLGIGRIGVPGTPPSNSITDGNDISDEDLMNFLRTGEIDG